MKFSLALRFERLAYLIEDFVGVGNASPFSRGAHGEEIRRGDRFLFCPLDTTIRRILRVYGEANKRRTAWRPTHESTARRFCSERRPPARRPLGSACARSRPGCAARHPAPGQGAAVHFSE